MPSGPESHSNAIDHYEPIHLDLPPTPFPLTMLIVVPSFVYLFLPS
ncbi:hypothetical protein [Legionella nagasakiensis]|nr:hypothetical protein [Legionella nagasakiensis]